MRTVYRIKEFRSGSFILEFYDSDLMSYPLYAKMVTPPSKIKFMEEVPDEINEFLSIPSIEDMSDMDILCLTMNLSITYLKFENSEVLHRVDYGKYMKGYEIYSFIEMNNTTGKQIDSMIIEIPGLKLLFHYDEYLNKVLMESSSFFYGKDNCMIMWYLKVLNRLINIKLCMNQNVL